MVTKNGLDVICAGMYRACSTWQYEVAAHLVEEHRQGRRLGYLLSSVYTAMLAQEAESRSLDSAGPRPWRVLKAHEGERAMARELVAGRARALYAYRDVRDVVFSLMHKRGKTFEEILRQGMIHQILANDRFWMGQPNVLVQRYEDLISQPARGVTELAEHLGLELGSGEAERITALYSQESNRARTAALKQKLEQAGVDLDSAGSTQIYDPGSLLHWNHMRQKDAASWRTAATPRQKEVLHRLCGRWLESRGYSLEDALASRSNVSLASVRNSLQSEIDMMVGLADFLVRTTSLRFPNTARTVKSMLGMATAPDAVASVWADAIPERSSAATRRRCRLSPGLARKTRSALTLSNRPRRRAAPRSPSFRGGRIRYPLALSLPYKFIGALEERLLHQPDVLRFIAIGIRHIVLDDVAPTWRVERAFRVIARPDGETRDPGSLDLGHPVPSGRLRSVLPVSPRLRIELEGLGLLATPLILVFNLCNGLEPGFTRHTRAEPGAGASFLFDVIGSLKFLADLFCLDRPGPDRPCRAAPAATPCSPQSSAASLRGTASYPVSHSFSFGGALAWLFVALRCPGSLSPER